MNYWERRVNPGFGQGSSCDYVFVCDFELVISVLCGVYVLSVLLEFADTIEHRKNSGGK